MKKVQDKLREIAGHLGIEATKLTAQVDSGFGTRESETRAGRGVQGIGGGSATSPST